MLSGRCFPDSGTKAFEDTRGTYSIKNHPIRKTVQKRTSTNLVIPAVILTTAAFWPPAANAASALTVNLGSASSFAILSGAGITIAAPTGTLITGDIGAYPTTSITGLENAIISGVNQAGNGITQSAKTSLMLAYLDAVARPADASFSDGFVLSGTYTGGVYKSAGSFSINSVLTLDAGGDSNMVWIFQAASTLDAASSSEVILTNGALASNVFWQVGSSATLHNAADFSGSILANQSVTLDTGASLEGRALALNGAVTLGSNIITIPEPSSTVLLGISSCWILTYRRRRGGA